METLPIMVRGSLSDILFSILIIFLMIYTSIFDILRKIIIRTLAEYNIKGERIDKLTGVWLDVNDQKRARKICAFGVRCSRWVTMHGFAFNVNTDLNYFNKIIPCGIADKAVTSLKEELGRAVDLNEVKEKVKKAFSGIVWCGTVRSKPCE